MPSRRQLRALASAIVPGLGQALGGRFVDAGLFLFASFWLRWFLGAQAPDDQRVIAFVFGAPAMTGGMRVPLLVVFTGILLGLHALAAWTVLIPPRPPAQAAPAEPKAQSEAPTEGSERAEKEGRARSGDLAP